VLSDIGFTIEGVVGVGPGLTGHTHAAIVFNQIVKEPLFRNTTIFSVDRLRDNPFEGNVERGAVAVVVFKTFGPWKS